MLPDNLQWITQEFEPEGDPRLLYQIARDLEMASNLEGAATVYDRAFGLDPHAADVRVGRQRVLEALTVREHGLVFRYIPAGPFLMGSHTSESDERPWHPVWLSAYWMAETPICWATYCQLMDREPPPHGTPRDRQPTQDFDREIFWIHNENKLRLQYCEDRTTRARDWHAHDPGQLWQQGNQTQTAQEIFGAPDRSEPDAPWRYGTKPMIAVSWQEAQEMAERISSPAVRYGLPTEAQWEKAARGGLIGARHAWGDEPPAPECCDFDRFRSFSIQPMTTYPPNGYGLYAMNGCVWEWTRDWYDSGYYAVSPTQDPQGPEKGEEKVLRGGSWADCADVVTVTFRMSRVSRTWRDEARTGHFAPNIGFRLCRTAVGQV